MKKVVFALFLTSLMLLSCGSDSEDVSDVNQQTILIYMPWSGSECMMTVWPPSASSLRVL